MRKWKGLAKRLLNGEEVTLSYVRYNDGTEEHPEMLINSVCACIEENKSGNKDIVVYSLKEDNERIENDGDSSRIPVINSRRILAYRLRHANEQFHRD